MIRFACPRADCRTEYRVPEAAAGKVATCPKCKLRVRVPRPLEPEPIEGDLLDEETGAVLKDWRDEVEEPLPKREATETTDDDDEPADRIRRSRSKPEKVATIAGMLIGGGAWAIFANGFGTLLYPIFCLWPGVYFGIIWGIFAIIRGAALLGDRWRQAEPRTLVLLQLLQVVNLDVVNFILGILGRGFLNERAVRQAFRRY